MRSSQRPTVLFFIQTIRNSFGGSVEVYTKGSCYQFYKILKQVFPQATAWYNIDHVITEINGKFYDITGRVKKDDTYFPVDNNPDFSHKRLSKLKLKVEIFDSDVIHKMKEMIAEKQHTLTP